MRVTLAYPRDGKNVGATVDLPDDVARELIYGGRARAASTDAAPAKPKAASKRRAKAAPVAATSEPPAPPEPPETADPKEAGS